MTLVISTGVSLSSSWLFPADPDAAAYVAAVEAADGQTLETATKAAIDNFVIGCKADGIWNAIKASCIMAGARTLAGALVPLKGTAPTNFNFVAGDYGRKTGLKGNGSTKYLNSNRNNNADPQNSKHLTVYITSPPTVTEKIYIGASSGTTGSGSSNIGHWSTTGTYQFIRINGSTDVSTAVRTVATGFIGGNRANSAQVTGRVNGAIIGPAGSTSQAPRDANITVFAEALNSFATDARLAFYSIGEAIDLALLDARVTGLMNDFAAVIP